MDEENRLAELVSEIELPDEKEAEEFVKEYEESNTYGEAQKFLDEYKENSNRSSSYSNNEENVIEHKKSTYMTYDGKTMHSLEDAKEYNKLFEKMESEK